MTDWKAIAAARGIIWDEPTATRQSAALNALETVFAALANEIPPEQEPAPVFDPICQGASR
ncbi:MAG: hypothetical protein JNL98_09000 [Bryobacterales bacterium]|nr:hypothetical protein [Bryobacterales bacterium]